MQKRHNPKAQRAEASSSCKTPVGCSGLRWVTGALIIYDAIRIKTNLLLTLRIEEDKIPEYLMVVPGDEEEEEKASTPRQEVPSPQFFHSDEDIMPPTRPYTEKDRNVVSVLHPKGNVQTTMNARLFLFQELWLDTFRESRTLAVIFLSLRISWIIL